MPEANELLHGTLDTLVLKTLAWGPRHGYAIARWVADTTGDDLTVEEGALYTALHRLEKRTLLSAEWGLSENNRKAKFYAITKRGVKALGDRQDTWSRLSTAVGRVLAR